jgi:hypothetical protein
MIPAYSRVVAIDDNEDHLKKIVWGLGKAGFCPIPFHFDDGKLENQPNQPLPGIRIVFTDIHMVGGAMTQQVIHANNIISCLKKIISNGPYVLIFWSQFPGDSDGIETLIKERALESGITLPIGFAAIDKNKVFKAAAQDGNDEFDAQKLRDLILEKISKYKTLAVAASWEDRAARAASRTTNRLFELVGKSQAPADDWEKLLAFLASEAVGAKNAQQGFTNALDIALLPLLEDQLYLIGSEPPLPMEDIQRLIDLVSAERIECPSTVGAAHLNASYLIEELDSNAASNAYTRGMVSQLGGGFVNSGPFIQAFGYDATTLIRQEFSTRDLENDEKDAIKLHIVELGPECDHAQEKISTQRYLLAVLVPKSMIGAFIGAARNGKHPTSPKYRNDSVIDIGKMAFKKQPDEEWHLFISTRCFMALAAKVTIDSAPRFRLRRALLEEVAHRYITHTRRPGVMRFKH